MYDWPTLRLHLAYTWPTLGLHLAYTWPTLGLHLAYPCSTFGLHLAYTWTTLGLQKEISLVREGHISCAQGEKLYEATCTGSTYEKYSILYI